ncbi:hypothetical protein TNCV_1831091 [Trichonephila clavipes]|nr:hypothetical protein TNCV_1831091 [Trichonephila clavipes]
MGYRGGSGFVDPPHPPLRAPLTQDGPRHLEKIRSSLYPRKVCPPLISKKIDLIQLARDLDESPDPSMSKIVLRNLIISSKYYKEEEAKELLEVITAERLETEQQQKLEQQEQLSIEKLRLEIELSRNANQSATQNNGQTSRVKSLDEIVKMVRLLTVKVPNKSDGDKVSNLLVNLGEEELKDYESLKQVVLKEYEPSPQKYV